MSIELKTANTELAITQEDDPIRVQLAASAINPVGAVKPAVASFYGIVPTIRFDTAVDMVAGLAFAIPHKYDRTTDISCRIGWAATANTGNVNWNCLYKWVSENTDTSGSADGTINVADTVSTTTGGYQFTSFTIPAPANGSRIIFIQIEREGTDISDTCAGNAHIFGLLCDFVAGVSP